MSEKVKVRFTYSLFESDSGYCIYFYEDCETNEKITCTGNYLPKIKNLAYEMTGTWKKTEKYGLNFAVSTYREIIESTRSSIVTYMSSILSGVGKKTAEKIYDMFGNSSLEVINNDPDQLLQIKGITKKKVEKISNSYKEKYVLRELTEYLLPYGITAKQALKLYTELKIKSIEELKEKPYALCEIFGISIQMADAVAKDFGYPEDGRERLVAHVMHVLYENEALGNTGMEANDFGKKLLFSLASKCYSRDNICKYIIDLIKDGVLSYKKIRKDQVIQTVLFRNAVYKTEEKLAKKIMELFYEKQPAHPHCKSEIEKYSKEKGFAFDTEQLNAVTESIRNSVTIITGGPGTGKTTIIRAIADYLSKNEKKKLFFMAPSGRAARRITESTGYRATTIHKGINYRPGEDYQNKEDKVSFENATIIIDEFSMVDTFLANLLLGCVEKGCRVIIVGDVNQLQSVGAGAVLRDLISSNALPVIRLTKIHRQSEDSMTYINAQNITKGIHDVKEGSDFKIIQSASPEEAQERMIEAYMENVSKYGIQSVYCLCPCKERAAGVKNMNEVLQKRLNPLKPGDKEFKALGVSYRIGDPVMHLKNSMEVSNGDIGYVTNIYTADGEKTLVVTYFGDTEVEYTMDEAEDMTLAYAFTVHKAQGSENKIVITFLSKTLGKNMLKRNLLNTSITRGSQLVLLHLTNDTALDEAIDNNDAEKRLTGLQYHLKYHSGQFV